MSEAPLTIRLNPADNVVTARTEITAGLVVPGDRVASIRTNTVTYIDGVPHGD